MIVNPQIFNYKLIIGSLIIAIAVLGSYSLSSYNTIKEQKEFTEQEIQLVQGELSNVISLYDHSRVHNAELTFQLDQAKAQLVSSSKSKNANLTSVSEYESLVSSLKTERKHLLDRIANVLLENEKLQKEVVLNSENSRDYKNEMVLLRSQNDKLLDLVSEVSELELVNLKVRAIKTNGLNADEVAEHALDMDNMEVCFKILENTNISDGYKDIYVQIMNPDKKTLANKGMVEFMHDSISYSGKTAINYRNKDLSVCVKVNFSREETLPEGDYLVSVFHKNHMLGTSKIKLN
ncbi:hypothetical protein ACW5R3_02830 [Bizionia sp. KMM 8389]